MAEEINDPLAIWKLRKKLKNSPKPGRRARSSTNPNLKQQEVAKPGNTRRRRSSTEVGDEWLNVLHSDSLSQIQKLEEISNIISRGVYVNHTAGPENRSPLHKASELGDPLIISHLLAHHADVNQKDRSGCTALHICLISKCGDYINSLRLLLSSGADSMILNNQGIDSETYALRQADHAACAIFDEFKRKR
eukprot:m.111388 g.111388  ORF g.111388 m.111388 type:complete len:192 (+) comp14061_c0_seq1:232-807(+)